MIDTDSMSYTSLVQNFGHSFSKKLWRGSVYASNCYKRNVYPFKNLKYLTYYFLIYENKKNGRGIMGGKRRLSGYHKYKSKWNTGHESLLYYIPLTTRILLPSYLYTSKLS